MNVFTHVDGCMCMGVHASGYNESVYGCVYVYHWMCVYKGMCMIVYVWLYVCAYVFGCVCVYGWMCVWL